MESTVATVQANQLNKDSLCVSCNANEQSNKITRLSALNILTAIGTRFFNGGSLSQEATESTQSTAWCQSENNVPLKDNSKKKKKTDLRISTSSSILKVSEPRKYVPKETGQTCILKNDRDFRRFKTKYNTTMGNIMREWMGLIYCILILRMNLIKFILKKLPEEEDEVNSNLHNQILLESKTVYDMIRNAQHFSQSQFLNLWTELEKLISNRTILKIAIQQLQTKESAFQDWRTANAKLTELENEYVKYYELYNDLQKSQALVEHLLKEKLAKLEKLVGSRHTAYETLVEQITEMKKKEVQMRGKILLNMKSYKDLKAKKQNLLNIEKEMNKLTTQQNSLVVEYSSKIQALKNEIEEKEKLIKLEKDEKKKIRATLEGFGDFADHCGFT